MKTEREFFPAKTDVMFKTLFTQHKDCLRNLISSLLGIPLEEMVGLHFKNVELPTKASGKKFTRLDLLVQVGKRIINIEVQVSKDMAFHDRSLFYWSQFFSMELEAGEGYKDLVETISLNLLDYELIHDELFRHVAHLTFDETGARVTEKMALYFYEMTKVSGKIDPKDKVQLWLLFMRANTKEELEMVKKAGDKSIAEAVDTVFAYNMDDELWWKAFNEKMRRHDEVSALGQAHRTGLEEGYEKGQTEGIKIGKEKFAKEIEERLKKMNMSQDQIHQILNWDK